MSSYYCCVEGCTSRNIKPRSGNGISFHSIPVKDHVRKEWLRVIFKHNPSFSVTDKSTVCSLHFTQSDYKQNVKKKHLIANAVPSIFPKYPTFFEVPSKRNRLSTEALHLFPNAKAGSGSSNQTTQQQSEPNCAEPAPVDIDKSAGGYSRSVGVQVSSLPTGQLETLKKENYLLRTQHYKLNETLKSVTGKVATIKVRYDNAIAYHKFKKLKATLKLNANSNTSKAKYLFEQIENHNKNQPHWCESTVKECMEWRFEAPKSFHFARNDQILTLPSRHTLERYIQNLDSDTALKYKRPLKVEDQIHTILISNDHIQIVRNTPKVLQNMRSLNIPCRKTVNRNLVHAFVISNILDSTVSDGLVTSPEECTTKLLDVSHLYRTPMTSTHGSIEASVCTNISYNNILQVEVPMFNTNSNIYYI